MSLALGMLFLAPDALLSCPEAMAENFETSSTYQQMGTGYEDIRNGGER
jgi:hypothetical protein